MYFVQSLWLIIQHAYAVIIALFGIGFIIAFHECGHFLFGKIFKVSIPSFSIGFGPKIVSKKIGETEFSLSAIPLGGYVEMADSAEAEEGKPQDISHDQYSFGSKPFYQKLIILVGGIAFNLIFAYFVFSLLFALGMPKTGILYPKNAVPIVDNIQENSAAAQFNLQVGDHIVAVNNQNTNNSAEQLINMLRPLANQNATLLIEKKDGSRKTVDVTVKAKKILGETVGSLGVIYQMIALPRYGFFDAIQQGIQLTNAIIVNTFSMFKYVFAKRDVSNMGGPLMIISATIKSAGQGFKIFLLLLAVISINLAVLNILPLPPLDGGRIMFTTIELIIRRPISIRIKEYISLIMILGLIILTIYLSIQDVARIFGPYWDTLAKFLRLR